MIVYRYRPDSKYLEDEIVKGVIFFGSTLKMNDFYDGYFRYTAQGDLNKYIEIFLNVARIRAGEILEGKIGSADQVKNLEKASGKDLKQWALSVLNDPTYLERSRVNLIDNFKNHPDRVQAAVDTQNKNADLIREKVFISCFSKKKLDMSMFGYYAADGKGVMIAYEDQMQKTRPINYVEALPVITIDKTPNETIDMHVMTKLKSWQHEQELRMYIYNAEQKRTDHGLKMKCIYMGPRASSSFTEQVKKWAGLVNVPVAIHSLNNEGELTWI